MNAMNRGREPWFRGVGTYIFSSLCWCQWIPAIAKVDSFDSEITPQAPDTLFCNICHIPTLTPQTTQLIGNDVSPIECLGPRWCSLSGRDQGDLVLAPNWWGRWELD